MHLGGEDEVTTVQFLYAVGLTLAGSITIAFTTLWLQSRVRKKKLLRALYHEVVGNLWVAKRNVEILNVLERHREKESIAEWTYFDISPLHTISYQDFRSSGEGMTLPEAIRMILDEAYEAVLIHNRQISFLTFEWPPRTGGVVGRLESLIEKLGKLQTEMKKTIKYLH